MPSPIDFNKILVTGAAGQLGRRFIENIKDRVSKIIALDIDGQDGYAADTGITAVKADITRTADLDEHRDELEDADHLVHLASVIEDSRDIRNDAVRGIDVDIMGTLNLLRYLPNLKGICYASSYMVYGPVSYLPVDENHPTEPGNIYGVCKLTVEKLLRLYAVEKRVPVKVLRYSGIYGPGTPIDSGRMIPSFVRRVSAGLPPVIYGEGAEKRPALYIDDAAEAISLAMKARPPDMFGVYNISGAASFTAAELAELVIRLSGRELVPEFEKHSGPAGANLNHVEIDISKARKELGFEPRTTLESGLKLHIEWFMKDQNSPLSSTSNF